MAVKEDDLWILDLIEQAKELKKEIEFWRQVENSYHLKQASYHATILVDLLYNEEVRLSGEEIIGMD